MVIMPLGDDRIEVRQAFEQGKIDPGHARARFGNRVFDVEVAAFED